MLKLGKIVQKYKIKTIFALRKKIAKNTWNKWKWRLPHTLKEHINA